MGDALHVAPESGRADRKAFLAFPYRLYRGHPVWVPPLRVAERDTFDRRRNPFFEHADVQHFLARRGRRVVGRIAAIANRLHNETHADRLGFFGFFDAEDDPEAVTALVDAARAWVAARGLDRLRGPANYSTNESCGVLVEGFDDPPAVLMPYNRPDYDALLRQAGLDAVKDLVSLWIPAESPVPERFRRVVERGIEHSGVRLRPMDLKDVSGEIRRLEGVYNRCWADNWGYVPATAAEFEHASGQMRMLLDPDLSAVAEIDGVPVGLSLILKDLNRVLRGTDGRLFPRGIFRLLFSLRKVDRVRIVALGVVPEARGRGITEAFFLRAMDAARRKGLLGGEAGWVLEDNRKMLAPIERAGGHVTKRYRMYEGSA